MTTSPKMKENKKLNLSEIVKSLNCEDGKILFDFTDTITKLNKMGIWMNNLFQLENGTWQCNVISNENVYDYGRGNTVGEAITAALLKTQDPESRKSYEKRYNLKSSIIEDFLASGNEKSN